MLDNTAVDGYYYLYGTWGYVNCHRSRDLMNWQELGDALTYTTTEEQNVLNADRWAPEVVYDRQENRYYMFLSATPAAANVTTGNGVRTGEAYEQMVVAVSDRPDSGFRLVNFKDASSCGAGNLHDYNDQRGISNGNGGYINAYPHYYAKYVMLDPARYSAFCAANGGSRGTYRGGFDTAIDPHPYVAPNGDKYLFWTDSYGADRIYGVKMINWLKPDWSTATALTYHSYYTVADWKAAQNGQSVQKVSYELSSPQINEGPAVTFHNGKYYLTFSVNSYGNNTYRVIQAVSDNVLGPYRKLTEAEGAILLSGQIQGGTEVSGTGHHSFVTAGKQTFIVYHRHNDPAVGGASRFHAIDEVRWITVKDIYGNDMDVMYVNGPTCSVQPKVEAHSYYRNLAGEATVSGSADAACLNDGLIAHCKNANATFASYIPETTVTETTTYTFDFDSGKTVRGIMIYNARQEANAIVTIPKIELVYLENGTEKTIILTDVTLESQYVTVNADGSGVMYITPAAAIHTELYCRNVICVNITVEVPAGRQQVGISEVKILGR